MMKETFLLVVERHMFHWMFLCHYPEEVENTSNQKGVYWKMAFALKIELIDENWLKIEKYFTCIYVLNMASRNLGVSLLQTRGSLDGDPLNFHLGTLWSETIVSVRLPKPLPACSGAHLLTKLAYGRL